MANPTTYFGWVMPTSSSLVTNLPADFNTFGQGVDTSLQDLLGGTTGQVLSKTSGTNMDFTWVTPTDQTPLTTKGDLFAFSTVDARLPAGANETRLVADSAQTLGLKYVADTTNYAIAAKADLLVGTAADTLAALTVGTDGQVLTADSTVSPTGLKWATPAGGGGKVLQVVQGSYSTSTSVATTTYTDTGLSLSITPTSATSKILIIVTQYELISRDSTDQGHGLRILRGGTEVFTTGATNGAGYIFNAGSTSIEQGIRVPLTYLDSPATTSATTYKTQGRPLYTTNSGQVVFQHGSIPSVITLMEIGA
jgi:hypothetical protein